MSGMEFGGFPVFRAATKSLRKRGHDVTSPVELNDAAGEKDALAIDHPRRAEFMRRDIEIVCSPEIEAVVVLPGWELSTGAQAEVAAARSIGKPVLTYAGLKPLEIGPGPIDERHPLSRRFHEILGDLGSLHDQKQRDYGKDDDPFANVRGTTEWGIEAWVGAMVRGTDKVKRLQQYARTGTLANEGARDSFLDLAVYSIIALVLWEESVNAPTSPS